MYCTCNMKVWKKGGGVVGEEEHVHVNNTMPLYHKLYKIDVATFVILKRNKSCSVGILTYFLIIQVKLIYNIYFTHKNVLEVVNIQENICQGDKNR